jgi:hypothetical protein
VIGDLRAPAGDVVVEQRERQVDPRRDERVVGGIARRLLA